LRCSAGFCANRKSEVIERSTLVPANFAGSGYPRVGRGTEQDRKISSDARHSRQKPTLGQTALAARSEAERRARREAKGPAEEPTGAADRQRTGASEREQ
jgi:hypothetical protein